MLSDVCIAHLLTLFMHSTAHDILINIPSGLQQL